ncbi:YybH family protein [Hansschlegelia sp. KR7-227]|uniref:YybH family protein n=1 Tax=Hansschlegelia sp. KR7-227 TaxID=3400914 RepID=UPI003C0DB051
MSDGGAVSAGKPEDLARLFLARANAGDLDGLVALYEPDAVLAAGDVVASGHAEIRTFYETLLAKRSHFPPVDALPPVLNGPLAMTFSRSSNGNISAEVARRQDDGTWRWAIDQLKIKPIAPEKA